MVRTPEYPGVLEQPFSARAGLGLNSLQAKLLCEALLAGLYTRPTLDCIYISFVIKHQAISLNYAKQLVYNSQRQVPDA